MKQPTEMQVTKEDQKYINEFSRLHNKNKNIDFEIRSMKETEENLKDAISSLDELFGESTKVLIGETFIELSEDEAADFLKEKQTKLLERKKDLVTKYEANEARLKELKIILYSKFKDSINLEE